MIWTAPIETEPGQGLKSHSNSRMESGHVSESHSHSTVTTVTQARSLCVAGAYLRSLDARTAVALMGSHCPGKTITASERYWLSRYVVTL